jgi:hypothetical protein
MEEQAVERVRNPEGGTKWALGSPRTWTPSVDVAKGNGTPRKGLEVERLRAGTNRRTLKERKAHERMNPLRK